MDGIFEAIGDAFRAIGDAGIAGAFCVVFIGIAIKLYIDKEKETKGRLEDSKLVTSLIAAPLEKIGQTLENQADERRKDNEELLDAIRDSRSRRK